MTSLGRTLSTYSSSSFVSQTPLNSSVFDSRSLQFEEPEAEPEVVREEPEPSLLVLSLLPSSAVRVLSILIY